MPAVALAATLDPADARPLTSREIAKLLCGVIGSMIAYDPHLVTVSTVESVVTLLIADPNGLAHLDYAAGMTSLPKSSPTWGSALGATILSLRSWCKPNDIQTALRWISFNLDKICSMGDGVAPVN